MAKHKTGFVTLAISIVALVISGLAWAGPFFGWPTYAEASQRSHSRTQYFTDLYTYGKNQNQQVTSTVEMAMAYASPDSIASTRARILGYMWIAFQEGGGKVASDNYIKNESDSVEICNPKTSPSCYVNGNFQYDASHRIQDYTVNDIPIDELTWPAAADSATDSGLTITFMGAIKLEPTDKYRVVFSVYNSGADAVSIGLKDAQYVATSGKRTTLSLTGASKLENAQTGWYFGSVRDEHGGWINFKSTSSAGTSTPHWIRTP